MRTLIATALLLLLAPAAEAKRPPCSRGGETVVSNSRVRVFERGDTLRACLKANRSRTILARRFDDGFVESADYGRVALAGSFVAWAQSHTDLSCKAACPPGYDPTETRVTIRDIATEDERSAEVAQVSELVLTFTGSAAWIDGDAVHALTDEGDRVLDTGAVSGLEASRTRVSWRNGGDLRVAAP